MTSLKDVRAQLREFTRARAWERFHMPKNLVMALNGEAGELTALFQWLDATEIQGWLEDPTNRQDVRHEFADVFAYLLLLADAVDIGPVDALVEKLALNADRYPVSRSRGKAEKHNRL